MAVRHNLKHLKANRYPLPCFINMINQKHLCMFFSKCQQVDEKGYLADDEDEDEEVAQLTPFIVDDLN